MMQKELIVLTGGAQRVGLECALSLQQAGYQLLVSYRSERPGLQALHDAGVKTWQADLSELSSLQSFIEYVKTLGPIRALIHNASDWQKDPALDKSESLAQELTEAAACFDAMQHIHARAPYLLNRSLLPQLQASTHADIIHLTDFVASVGSSKHLAYAASKAALENMTLSLARQLAPNIKVNSIAPALLMFNPGDDAEYRQKALAKSLLQCEPGAREVVAAVHYLLNSQYMTGRTLQLDGGRHLNLP